MSGAQSAVTVVAIVQARMGSSRLPGKSLEHIGGVPVAEIVVRRLSRCRQLERIVLATSTASGDERLADRIAGAGFAVFRGSETDLLLRYHDAARKHGATHVVRVGADNVFVDPVQIDRLVGHGLASGDDFVGFVNPAHPERNDFGGEFMRVEALEKAHSEANSPHDREHVYPYFKNNPGKFRLGELEVDPSLDTVVKLDLDYPADLDTLRAIADVLGDPVNARSADVARTATRLFGSAAVQ